MLQDVRYFGPRGYVYHAAGCTVSVPHEELTCTTAPGAGRALNWVVVVDEQVSVTPTYNYYPPEITGLSGPGAVNGSTFGGEEVVITGDNFGPAPPAKTFLQASLCAWFYLTCFAMLWFDFR